MSLLTGGIDGAFLMQPRVRRQFIVVVEKRCTVGRTCIAQTSLVPLLKPMRINFNAALIELRIGLRILKT